MSGKSYLVQLCNGISQIVQLWNNNGRLGIIVYEPKADGSYAVGWGTGNAGEGSGAIAFSPVTMNGDGKTQIVQLWNNNERLGKPPPVPDPE